MNFANLDSSPAAAASPSTPTMEPSQVVEYNLSATGTKSSNPGPLSIVAAGNGSFWVAEFSGGAIAQFFPSNGTFHQFPVPSNDSLPAYITVDRRGMVWFSDQGGTGTIWMFNPSTKSFTPHPTFCQDSVPVGVLVDAQNNVWFAEDSCSRLGELTYPNYVQEEYPLPLAGSGPAELAKGGVAIWITESIGNRIAMFNTTTRAFKEFTPSVPFGSPVGIVLDSQGIVW